VSSWSWWDELEDKLEQQLEAFLRSHPEQSARLREELLSEAAQLRRTLLELAAEIKQWQGRTQRAQAAGAHDLAKRAQDHLDGLMQQGRGHWQRLEAIGQELQQRPAQAQPRPAPSPSDNLDAAWARFETEQALEELRRRQGI
jgi:hercynine metabolism protein